MLLYWTLFPYCSTAFFYPRQISPMGDKEQNFELFYIHLLLVWTIRPCGGTSHFVCMCRQGYIQRQWFCVSGVPHAWTCRVTVEVPSIKCPAVTKLYFTYEFQENVDLGELMFSLCYLPTAGRLTITMIKARNLKAMDITGASGGFWKCSGERIPAGEKKTFLIIPGWSHHVSLGRSICEGVPDVRRPEAEEEKDVDKAQHSEPRVQRGHRFRRSSREHWPDQPAHRRHGLWSVSTQVGFFSCSIFTHAPASMSCHFCTFRVGHNEVIGVCRVGNGAESLGRDHWSEMLTYPRKPIARWHPLIEVWTALVVGW